MAASRRPRHSAETRQRRDVAVAERGPLRGDESRDRTSPGRLVVSWCSSVASRSISERNHGAIPVTRWSSAAGTPRRRSASSRQSRESDGCEEALEEDGPRRRHRVLAIGADEAVGRRRTPRPRDRPARGRRRDGRALPCPASGSPAGEDVQRRCPGRVLGQEAGARLLEAAQRLVERGAERAVDGHDLAGRLHLRAEPPLGAGELVEGEARQLDDDVVERGLERRDRRLRDRVGDLVEAAADGDLGRHARDRIARRLRRERRRAADARVDLDDGVVGGVGRQRELDVAAALDAERPDDVERRASGGAGARGRAASGPERRRSSRRCGRPAGRRSPSSTPRCTCRRRRA